MTTPLSPPESTVTPSGSSPNTISLIGMPGVGKSTIGVLLAKLSGLTFTDTDILIQVREGATLQQIIERDGFLRLRHIEQEVLLDVALERSIIATGGSVVYSDSAMQRLADAGPVVYLHADLDTLHQRVASAPPRGIASAAGSGFADVYNERTPLYQRYSDVTIDAIAGTPDDIAQAILAAVTSNG